MERADGTITEVGTVGRECRKEAFEMEAEKNYIS